MNCLDCLEQDRLAAPAVAVCTSCGAAVCREHLVLTAQRLTRFEVMGREVPVDPPARTARCRTCQAAFHALSPAPPPARADGRRRSGWLR